MATIEEKAAAFADSKISGKVGKQCIAIGYIHGAQEQDRIARAEERERCIQIAQNYICYRCIGKDEIGKCAVREACEKRGRLWHMRKALEGGEG